MDEIRIIDIVEKMRNYLLSRIPALEKRLQDFREPPGKQSAYEIKMLFLGVLLGEEIDSAPVKRKLKLLLDDLERGDKISQKSERKSQKTQMILQEGVSLYGKFNEARIRQIRQHLQSIDTLWSGEKTSIYSQLAEFHSGIEAVNYIRRNLPLLKGLRVYHFLTGLDYPVFVPDKHRQRLLSRLGFLRKVGADTAHYQRVAEIAEEIHRVSGETLNGLNLIFGLFSGAINWGTKLTPLCLRKPRCFQCPLTNYCDYYHYIGETKEKESITFYGLKQLDAQEMPREKMLREGVGVMSNAELLAIILRTGTPEMSALDLGKMLIKRFKTLDALAEASIKEISELPGIGEIKAVEIKASLELGKRLLSSGVSELGTVTSSADVFKLYQGKLSQAKQEMFFVLLLNTKNRIIREVLVSKGSLDTSLIHPREVFKEAIRESSASVIFVHNHPSGDPQPSKDDIAITHRLYETGEIIGIKVLDHVIIGRNSYYSFLDNGLLRGR